MWIKDVKVIMVLVIIAVLGVAVSAGFFTDGKILSEGIELISAHADPVKVRPGDNLNTIVAVRSGSPVIEGTARYHHEKGTDEVPMILIAHSEDLYTMRSLWKVHDTLDQKWYKTEYEIVTESGEVLMGEVEWQDPTVSHLASQVEPGEFQAGNFTFPGNVTLGNMSLQAELGQADCAKITGSTALCDGGDADTRCSTRNQCSTVYADVIRQSGSSAVQIDSYDQNYGGRLLLHSGHSDIIEPEIQFEKMDSGSANPYITIQGSSDRFHIYAPDGFYIQSGDVIELTHRLKLDSSSSAGVTCDSGHLGEIYIDTATAGGSNDMVCGCMHYDGSYAWRRLDSPNLIC